MREKYEGKNWGDPPKYKPHKMDGKVSGKILMLTKILYSYTNF